jgi:DNA repair protein RadD
VQAVVNVVVPTEGWNHPPTCSAVRLRPSSYKSTMIQMVGRGLRTVSPEEQPPGHSHCLRAQQESLR